MIRVIPLPEPDHFKKLVRDKGAKFLLDTPNPTTKQYSTHDYWSAVKKDLYEGHGCVCHFSAHWIPPDTGSITVEHFKPKSIYPNLAYEWTNYRLMSGSLNGRKKNFEDVIDPFSVNDNMFEIDFPSLLIKPAKGLKEGRSLVESTIKRLRLNDDGSCLKGREGYVKEYCKGDITFDFMKRRAPFLAQQIEKKKLQGLLQTIMRYP